MTVDVSTDPLHSVSVADAAAAAESRSVTREWLRRNGLLVFIVSGYAAAMLALARRLVSTDSWFALATGRFVARHGLPTHDTLTIWSYGRRWIDEQWLAQLAIYELQHVGGLRLAIAAHIFLVTAALAGAITLARVRGAHPTSIALIVAVALLPLAISAEQLRTQSFAYVLFLAVLALTTTTGRISPRRLALALALLVLWGNLHGSATLGAGLVALRGAVDLVDGWRAERRARALSCLQLVLPWLCLLATPYLFSTPHYYAQTLFNPALSRYLAQWQPSTLSILSVPLFALVFGFVWLIARAGAVYSRFETLAGIVLVIFALLAFRNWVWLCLFAIGFFPKGLDAVRATKTKPREERINRVLGFVGLTLAALAAVAVLPRPDSWFARDFPSPAAQKVARLAAAHPNARVWATTKWADWLLWENPELAGRLAFDARVELLSEPQVKRLAVFSATPLLVPQVRRRYRILVVDRTDDADAYRLLRRQGRVIYDNGELLVAASPSLRGAS